MGHEAVAEAERERRIARSFAESLAQDTAEAFQRRLNAQVDAFNRRAEALRAVLDQTMAENAELVAAVEELLDKPHNYDAIMRARAAIGRRP
jgi:cell division protein FtsB